MQPAPLQLGSNPPHALSSSSDPAWDKHVLECFPGETGSEARACSSSVFWGERAATGCRVERTGWCQQGGVPLELAGGWGQGPLLPELSDLRTQHKNTLDSVIASSNLIYTTTTYGRGLGPHKKTSSSNFKLRLKSELWNSEFKVRIL